MHDERRDSRLKLPPEPLTEVVGQFMNLVYSTALRHVRDRHVAEDVTQNVFLILLRKAAHMRPEGALAAWLLKTTYYECADTLKRERRRVRRERRAARLEGLESVATVTDSCDLVEPLLHEALARLNAGDRRAIVLRYIEGLNINATADALGISENACKQRVFRGIECLRRFFAARGVHPSASLATVLSSPHFIIRAPSGLSASVVATAAAQAKWSGPPLSKGAFWIMATTKAKAVLACLVILLFISAAGIGLYVSTPAQPSARQAPAPTRAPDVPTAPFSQQLETLPQGSSAKAQGQDASVVTAPVVTGPKRAIKVEGGMVVVHAGEPQQGATYGQVRDAGRPAPEVSRTSAEQLRAVLQRALADPAYAAELKITREQLEKLKRATSMEDELESILTPQQLQKIRSLTGGTQD